MQFEKTFPNKLTAMQTDRPISKADQDRFDRKHFAQRIAQVISARSDKTGLVVGIHGPWGEGKTSVLNMIAEELSTDDQTILISFNPWRFQEEPVLLRAFFFDIAKTIDSSLITRSETLGSIANDYADLLSVIPGYGGAAKGLLRGWAAKRTNIDVDALKERFVNALSESKKRLVVVMDDIDRLDKSEVQTVFRLVKLLADFPNMTYILAFDDERVAEALGDRYGPGGGRNFLEKIIQVPLSLPPTTARARRDLALEGLQTALASSDIKLSEESKQRFADIFDKAFLNRITTPRLAKRFGNGLTFALPMVIGEVDLVDLIFLEAIRTFYPELYRAIRDNDAVFLGTVFDGLGRLNETEAKAQVENVINAALRNYSEADQKSARMVIQDLFPRTGASGIYGPGGYSAEYTESLAKDKRVAARDYFWRYYNYGVTAADIRDQDVQRFLEQLPRTPISDSIEQFRALASDGRSVVLIGKLRVLEDEMLPETAAILALVVARSGKELPYSHPVDRFFGLAPYAQASALIRHLLHRVTEQSARESLAVDIANEIQPLPFAYDFLSWMRKMKRSHYSDEMVSVVSEECEDRIRKIIATRLTTMATQAPIERAYPLDAQQLYGLWSSVDEESLRDYLEKRFEEHPDEAAEFISAANGVDPGSNTSRDWSEDAGWFGFICNLIEPTKMIMMLRKTYPSLEPPEYNFSESQPMNNKMRAARWFYRLHKERFGKVEVSETQSDLTTPSAPEPSLDVFLDTDLTFESDERDQYQLIFSVKNLSKKPVNDYRIEVEFPSAFLQAGWHPEWEEPERATETHRFFRMTQGYFEGGASKWILYGDDTRRLFKIEYHVDQKNYRAEFLQQEVWVTAFLSDIVVRRLQKPMRDLVKEG